MIGSGGGERESLSKVSEFQKRGIEKKTLFGSDYLLSSKQRRSKGREGHTSEGEILQTTDERTGERGAPKYREMLKGQDDRKGKTSSN